MVHKLSIVPVETMFEKVEIREVQAKWHQYCELLQLQSK